MKLWGGRFGKATEKIVDDFNSSIHIDSRMYKEDIQGSIAHARMLGECNIIEKEDATKIISGLQAILQDIEAGEVQFSVSDEDVHMNIEKLLIERIGEAGKKLHTARSRNDQVALDFRMYQKSNIEAIVKKLLELEETLLQKATENIDVIMPGYTHLQKAQPITMGHHIMAYFQMFGRDMERFMDCYWRTDVMPLGSCALAGTTYGIDRDMVSKELGFSSITMNSLDGVSDRDFAIEFINCCAIAMMHMSRFCEELIIWSSSEFSFVEMDDAYSTGSSIMPQKKNPDVAELIRGKTGRVYGNLMAMLTVMKSLPLAYNKDMQEDKEITFDAGDTVLKCLEVFIPMFKTIIVKNDEIRKRLRGGFLNATDVADYLVKKGIPFRTTHEISGKIVKHCIERSIDIGELTLEEFKSFSAYFEKDIFEAIDFTNCVNKRNTVGGPSKKSVQQAIEKGRASMKIMENIIANL